MAGLGTALVTGCDVNKDKIPSQVAARVGSTDITVHQLSYALQQRGVAPAQVESASKVVLEQLVDRTLASQQAVEMKLDRDPVVLQGLESARQELLARAYLERQATFTVKPKAADVDAYFAAHPALFADRRVYTVEEVEVETGAASFERATAIAKGARDSSDYIRALTAAGLRFAASTGTRAAEDIPLSKLDMLASLQNGQKLTLQETGRTRTMFLVSSVAAPLSLEQARPTIEQFLLNSQRRTDVQDKLKALRNSAKVEYFGKYAQASGAGASAPARQAP